MRYCLFFLSVVTVFIHCVPASKMPVAGGELVLHVWIYYKSDPGELKKIVDSSHCSYTQLTEKEGDGCTRMEFSFRPDPTVKQMNKLITRLKRYRGMRSFATTRNQPIMK